MARHVPGIGLFAVLVCLILQTGCSYQMGNEKITDESTYSEVEKGVTTKEKIQLMYGRPMNMSFTDNNEEIWSYTYMKSSTKPITFVPIIGLIFGGMKSKYHTLTIRFAEDGTVKEFGAGEMKGGGGGI